MLSLVVVIAVAAIAFLSLLGRGLWNLHRSAQQTAQQIQKFDQATSKSKLLGKTPEQILALLGKPAVDERRPDNGNGTQGSFDMLYEGPFLSWGVPDRRMCYITFDNGRVSEVHHSSNGNNDDVER